MESRVIVPSTVKTIGIFFMRFSRIDHTNHTVFQTATRDDRIVTDAMYSRSPFESIIGLSTVPSARNLCRQFFLRGCISARHSHTNPFDHFNSPITAHYHNMRRRQYHRSASVWRG